MPYAVGVIETLGFPAILAAADAMVKSGRVTLVYFDKSEKGRFYVAIRGNVAEVDASMKAGIKAGNDTNGGEITSHYTIPNPTRNVEDIMAIHFSDDVEEFRI